MTSDSQFRPVLQVGEITEDMEVIELQPVVRTVIKGQAQTERPWVRALKDSEEQRVFDAAHQGLRDVRIDGVPHRITDREEREGDWIIYWLEVA